MKCNLTSKLQEQLQIQIPYQIEKTLSDLNDFLDPFFILT